MVQKDRVTDLFCSLAAITSPTYGERQMADRLRRELECLGFAVAEDNAGAQYGGSAGNLRGLLPGVGEPLLFCCHMDTVGPCRDRRVLRDPDGTIRSDGATTLGADDLAGVAELLEAVRSIQEDSQAHRPIEVLFTIGEEHFLSGSRALDVGCLQAREGYVLDVDGDIGTAVLRAPTGIRMIAKVRGVRAHAGMSPEKGVNAIAIAALAVSRVTWGRLDDETTANVGIIQGGDSGNIVPDACQVEMETRSLSREKAETVLRQVQDAFAQAAAELGGSAELEIARPLTAYRVPEDAPVVRAFVRACRAEGIAPVLGASCGGSDNTVLCAHGIQCIVVAPGMHQVHGVTEYTSVRELDIMSRVVQRLMTQA